MNVEIEIADAMRSCGIMPPRYISFDGKIHRFGKNKSSWYVFYDGHVKGGAFGDWKTGVSEKFIEARQDITPMDRKRIAQAVRETVAQRERELRQLHVDAANQCVDIWDGAGESGRNDYLTSKGLQVAVTDYGLRQGTELFNGYRPFDGAKASLIVPVMDIYGVIHSIQFIAPDGRKRFYAGGSIRGHFCPIGLQGEPEKILIAEGVATALTLFEDTGLPVIAAFNANNLVPVAESIRWKYASVDILICGDDDHTTEGNPGRTKAIETAARCGGDWVLPDFSGLPRGPKDTDFNDLRQLLRCAA
jgi:putative DNA primase/helicase